MGRNGAKHIPRLKLWRNFEKNITSYSLGRREYIQTCPSIRVFEKLTYHGIFRITICGHSR
jgi:hypothetical protein